MQKQFPSERSLIPIHKNGDFNGVGGGETPMVKKHTKVTRNIFIGLQGDNDKGSHKLAIMRVKGMNSLPKYRIMTGGTRDSCKIIARRRVFFICKEQRIHIIDGQFCRLLSYKQVPFPKPDLEKQMLTKATCA